MNKESKLYHYITIYNFRGIDIRVSCEFSFFEYPEEKLNKILDVYNIIFKVDDKLFNEIYKLLYEKEELNEVK